MLRQLKKDPTKQKALFSSAAIVLGGAMFCYSMRITESRPVRTCCDSSEYISLSNTIHSLSDIVHFTGDRTIGYPLFLATCRGLTHYLPVLGNDWILISEIISLVLFWISVTLVLSRLSSLFKVPSVTWPVCLLSTCIVGYAAVPLSDVLSLDILLFAFTLVLKIFEKKTNGNYIFSVLAGSLFGLAILVRPSLQLSVVPFLIFFLFVLLKGALPEKKTTVRITLAMLLLASFAFILSPQVAQCRSKYGRFCIQSPEFVNHAAARSMEFSLKSPRITGGFSPPAIFVYVDPYMERHFGKTHIDENHIPFSFLTVMIENAPYVPLFFLKKMIGLFDNTDINGFGAAITPYWVTLLNQFFGMLGFIGFFLGVPYLLVDLKGSTDWPRNKIRYFLSSSPFLFATIYLITLSPFHMESRYIFPAYPFCLIAFFVSARLSRLPLYLLAGLIFTFQIYLWQNLVPQILN